VVAAIAGSAELTAEAMHDIAHYLRPAHLAQLRTIIDDPESNRPEGADDHGYERIEFAVHFCELFTEIP
jgi:hypothetical protein